MSALPLRPDTEFSEEEEHTGIHVRPTLSMPPTAEHDSAALAISSSISALLAEAEAEEKIEDLSYAVEDAEVDTLIARVAIPPPAAANTNANANAIQTPSPKAFVAPPPAPSPLMRAAWVTVALLALAVALDFYFFR